MTSRKRPRYHSSERDRSDHQPVWCSAEGGEFAYTEFYEFEHTGFLVHQRNPPHLTDGTLLTEITVGPSGHGGHGGHDGLPEIPEIKVKPQLPENPGLRARGTDRD